MSHRVVFAPEAEAQLVALYRYIMQEASGEIAGRFTNASSSTVKGLPLSHIAGHHAMTFAQACAPFRFVAE
jgi:hypothetical protein